MRIPAPSTIRGRLTLWYVSILSALLLLYAATVFIFQYAVLTRQIFHDEIQDVLTVEGLLYFDTHGALQLHQDYYSRPQSHLLNDRMMEIRDLSGNVLYRSATLKGLPLGGPNQPREGDVSFNERLLRLADGRHVFVVSHIHSMNGHHMLIRLGYSLVPLRDRMWQFLGLLFVSLPLAITIAALAGQTIARRALQPLEEMTVHAQSITATNLHHRLSIANPEDELGHMAAVFNHLLERLEQAFRQLQRFTADAAHELRTPLASLRAVGEVALAKDEDQESYREALSSILEETNRLNETVNSLLLLARAETSQPDSTGEGAVIGELIHEGLQLFSVLIEERQIHIVQENEHLSRVFVVGDRTLLRIALLNVLHNALKFSPPSSILKITYQQDHDSSCLQLVIEDQGPGIARGEHERIFERFFRGRSSSMASVQGTGLGLPIARLIMERADGSITFDEMAVLGARCILRFRLK